ncbi:hypothetical protein FSARC_12964 [Fusarium sarcochroum]|uniref:Trichothecene 3-O-acetyltransferase-like N-terminal domain-containing protein n=1 Tax=Fusarium sarcochroum TaxID=1208366 RepID=A0A8H4T4N8_9HYPO|nr:hypothetical protein FSARC_12964 [Fusarium sarcochroum]
MDDMIEIPLSPIDHAAPRHYCAFRFYLPLKPGVTPESAFKVLHEGLHRTFAQLPWLSGQTWDQDPNAKDYRPGQLVIRHRDVNLDGPWPSQLDFHQLDSDVTFDELRDEGFPTDALPESQPEWISFPPDVGKGPDVFKAQACFIPGGCILLAGPQHLICDGTAAISIVNLWAEHCRALQLQSDVSVLAPLPASSDRSLLADACKTYGSKDSPDSAAWRLFGRSGPPPPVSETDDNHAPPAPLTEVPMRSVIFYIPADRLTLLYQNSIDAGSSGVSTIDALSALIWTSALKARRNVALQDPHNKSEIQNEGAWAAVAIMFDGRGQLDSDLLLSGYLGNMTCVNLGIMPLAELTSHETSLASIARVIREGAAGVNPKSLMDAYALADTLPDFNRLKYADMPLDGTALQISPLLSLPASGLDFGGQLFGNGGCPEALRPPMDWFNRSSRTCFILPKLSGGGVEMVLNLFDQEMDMLLQDPKFLKYAVYLAD